VRQCGTRGRGGGGRTRGAGAGPPEALVSSREDRLGGRQRKRAASGILSDIQRGAVAYTFVRNALVHSRGAAPGWKTRIAPRPDGPPGPGVVGSGFCAPQVSTRLPPW
jgi:hypothetical protein